MTAPDTRRVRLVWTGDGMAFRGGREGGAEIVVDSGGVQGPSPMEALLLALAGCMAVDLVHILEKSRVTVEGLEAEVEGERAATPPRRYVRLRLSFRVRGPEERDQPRLDRALALSRETYCSVFHTLRPDLDVTMEIHRVEEDAGRGGP